MHTHMKAEAILTLRNFIQHSRKESTSKTWQTMKDELVFGLVGVQNDSSMHLVRAVLLCMPGECGFCTVQNKLLPTEEDHALSVLAWRAKMGMVEGVDYPAEMEKVEINEDIRAHLANS